MTAFEFLISFQFSLTRLPVCSFPDSEEIPSLYEVLSVPSTATGEDLKRSFRRLSLLFHPDKINNSQLSPEEATLKFQQIGFAYSIFKDPIQREKYDQTGSTAQLSGGGGEGAKTEQEWKDYFKELWTGEVTADSIEEFKNKYQGKLKFSFFLV
jgi:DnaJ family protein C protein 9